ncbi:MAG: LemA family protein [Candidatus Riflebacteria bacterium]|nr:LemA family protein [Candidatus Riflebacteria bacterium]
MSRLSAVIKKTFFKEFQPSPPSPKKNGIAKIIKKWNLENWDVRRLANFRTICIVSTCVAIVAIFSISGIVQFNRFKESLAIVNARKADLEKEFRRRDNLIPNIDRLTEKYSNYEETVFKCISASRESFGRSHVEAAFDPAGKELEKSLSEMIALSEQYPNLKSAQSIQSLMAEIITTETRIAKAKKGYNDVSEDYNQLIETFPGNIYATIFGFEDTGYSGIESSKEANSVSSK